MCFRKHKRNIPKILRNTESILALELAILDIASATDGSRVVNLLAEIIPPKSEFFHRIGIFPIKKVLWPVDADHISLPLTVRARSNAAADCFGSCPRHLIDKVRNYLNALTLSTTNTYNYKLGRDINHQQRIF